MVAGISRALESGKVYTRTDLRAVLFVDGASLDQTIAVLVEDGKLRSVAAGESAHDLALELFEAA